MAARNALLPAYQVPAGIDFAPLSNAFTRAGQINREVQRTGFEQDQATQRMQLAQNADKRAGQDQDFQVRRRQIDEIGNLAVAADNEKDPARRASILQTLIARHPDADNLPPEYRDPIMGPRLIRAEAGKARNELSEQLIQAQIKNLNRREEPEIVRQLRAAGVDPQSEQGRAMILNAIKGGDPISQAIAERMRANGGQPQGSPIRPQSFAPDAGSEPPVRNALVPPQPGADPNIIQAQTAPQIPDQPPRQPMADTPLGPMPRDQARLFGFGLAMQGKGEAGKMFADPASPDAMAKEARNQLDKKQLDTTDVAARLSAIEREFKPEFQTYEKSLEMMGVKLMDSFAATRQKIKPGQAAEFEKYATFRQNAYNNLSEYIKLVTGAAMGVQEEARIRKGVPDPDKDSPREFATKLKNSVSETKMALARYNYLRRNEFRGDAEEAARVLPLSRMRNIIDQRGGELEQRIRQENPQADRNTVTKAVRSALSQEFGI